MDVRNWDEVDRVREMEGCWAGLHVEKRVSELNQPTNLKEGGRWSGLTNEESVGLEVVSQGTVCRNWTNRDRGQQQGAPAKRQTGGREGTEDSVHGREREHKSLVWFRWRCRPLQHRFTAFWRQQPLAAPSLSGAGRSVSVHLLAEWQSAPTMGHYGLAAGSRRGEARRTARGCWRVH